MKPDSDERAVPELLLERYRLNEVSRSERAEIERRLREDAGLRARLAELERSDEALRASGFADALARRIQREADRGAAIRPKADRGPGRVGSGLGRIVTGATGSGWFEGARRWALPAAIAVTALLVAVVVGSRGVGPHTGSAPDPTTRDSADERIKGLLPSLTVFRQTSHGSETLVDGAGARRGDVVRLAYQAAGQSFGVIVSIDGRGSVTLHLPPEGREAARLRPGARVLLDQAYELDDAPRWECFYFVTAEHPFDTQAVVDAAKREAEHLSASPPAKLSLSPGLEQSTFVLDKEHRP